MPDQDSAKQKYDRLMRQLQQTVLTEYPNPERQGCPGDRAVRALALRYLDLGNDDDPDWHHVTHCSPCYREFLGVREEMKRAAHLKRVRVGLGLAGVAVVAVTATSVYLNRSVGSPPPPRPQIAELQYRVRVIDLDGRSPTRSGSEKKAEPIVLGRGPEELRIRLPFGSAAGEYNVEVVQDARPVAAAGGTAQIVNGSTWLNVKVNLSTVVARVGELRVRRVGSAWKVYPSEVRE